MEYYDSDSNKENEAQNEKQQPASSPNDPNRMAIVSMVCGIVGILLLCCCVAFPLSIILGVAAITLAILSRKGEPFSGYAIAGLILGVFALLLGIAEFVYLMAVNMLLRDPQWAPFFDEVMEQYQELMPVE